MNENKGNKINYKINPNKRSKVGSTVLKTSTRAPRFGLGASRVRGFACKHADLFKPNAIVWLSFKTKKI